MTQAIRASALLALVSMFFVGVTPRTGQADESQSFDSEATAAAAGWVANEEAQKPDRNIDLGWQNSNLAGVAAAGEGGGLLHRSGTLPIAFYADPTIGEFTLDDPLSASGKVSLFFNDFDGY